MMVFLRAGEGCTLEARNLDEVLKAFSCVNCGIHYNVELVNDAIAGVKLPFQISEGEGEASDLQYSVATPCTLSMSLPE